MQLIKVTKDAGEPIYVNADLVLWVHPLPVAQAAAAMRIVERTAIGLAGQQENGGLVIVKVRESIEDIVLAMGGCIEVV